LKVLSASREPSSKALSAKRTVIPQCSDVWLQRCTGINDHRLMLEKNIFYLDKPYAVSRRILPRHPWKNLNVLNLYKLFTCFSGSLGAPFFRSLLALFELS
jgi:hypothetical protein